MKFVGHRENDIRQLNIFLGASILLFASIALTISACGSGSVEVPSEINWTPPTEYSDGSDFTDLFKYRLYYGPNEGSLKWVLDINSQGVAFTSYTFSTADRNALASFYSGNSTHVFAMTAVNSLKLESSFSNIITY